MMGGQDDGRFLNPQTSKHQNWSRTRSQSPGRKSPNLVSWGAGDILHKATEVGDIDTVVQTLKDYPGCVDARNPRGRTALHEAACNGRVAIVKILFEYGADINARSYTGYTALTFATESGSVEVIMALIERRADLNAASTSEQVDLRGHTPLHRAALRENLASVQLLAAKGASVNAVTANGITAQQIAIQKGSPAIVLVLAAFGTNYSRDAQGNDATYYAQALDGTRREQIMAILSKWTENSRYRSDLLRCQRSGELSRFFNAQGNLDLLAMLCWATARGRLGVIEYVLDMSAWEQPDLVNGKDQSGWTALHHAARGGEYTTVRRLLEAGATVDSLTTNRRWTPLLLAAEKGRRRTVQVLLQHKADILSKTHRDATALDLAAEGKHKQTLDILISEIRNTKFIATILDTRRRKLAMIEYHKTEAMWKKTNEEVEQEVEQLTHVTAATTVNLNENELYNGAFDGTLFSTSRMG